ncbi:MAG: hypothetical protein LBD18_06895 [Treponema sp.]|jgi:cell shape-determining protein MreC|nr:hypothetical protein [Treponema sp.]
MEYLGLLIPIMALGIPFFAIYLSHKQKTQKNKIREMELQKEILELEIHKQNSRIELLEEENKRLDKDLMLLGKQ